MGQLGALGPAALDGSQERTPTEALSVKSGRTQRSQRTVRSPFALGALRGVTGHKHPSGHVALQREAGTLTTSPPAGSTPGAENKPKVGSSMNSWFMSNVLSLTFINAMPRCGLATFPASLAHLCVVVRGQPNQRSGSIQSPRRPVQGLLLAVSSLAASKKLVLSVQNSKMFATQKSPPTGDYPCFREQTSPLSWPLGQLVAFKRREVSSHPPDPHLQETDLKVLGDRRKGTVEDCPLVTKGRTFREEARTVGVCHQHLGLWSAHAVLGF